jgi:hypothetical protein
MISALAEVIDSCHFQVSLDSMMKLGFFEKDPEKHALYSLF